MPMDPTARDDMIAARVRAWYEANRESWWARHAPFGPAPDRYGAHADEFILRLIDAVNSATADVAHSH